MLATLIGIVAAGCVGVAIVDGPSKRRSVFMAAAIILAGVLLAADQWNATQVAELRGSPGLLAAVFVVGAAAIAATASLIRRWPVLLPVLILIALPFRIPLELGGEEANLLVPLYLVMAGGVAATIWGRFTEAQPASWRVSPEPTGLARWLKPLLAASVVLYALAVLYSDDRSTGLQNLCFFLIPFATVFALMDEVEWNMKTLRLILVVIVFEALACAFVGFIEWGTRSLLWNETVVETNNFHVYFRVNSLFWDPNIYGRYLALAITMVSATLLWSRRSREAWILAGVTVILWVALLTTYSQSSFIALVAGLLVLAALKWSLKWVSVLIGALAVGALCFAAFAGSTVKLDFGALNKQTSGRADLVSGGVELFGNRPVQGYGSGSFSVAFKDVIVKDDNAPVTESHTEPITIASEQGLIGLLIYVLVIVASIFALTAGMRTVMPGLDAAFGSRDPSRGPPVARAAVLAAFIAVLVHTVTYAGFLEDPITWVLIAIGYSLAFPCRATSAA